MYVFGAHRLQYINSYLFYIGLKEDQCFYSQTVVYSGPSVTCTTSLLPSANKCIKDRTLYYLHEQLHVHVLHV